MIFGVPCEGAVVFGIFENLAHRVKDFFSWCQRSTVADDLVRNKFDLHCIGVSDVGNLEKSPTPRLRGTSFHRDLQRTNKQKISSLYTLER